MRAGAGGLPAAIEAARLAVCLSGWEIRRMRQSETEREREREMGHEKEAD